jgi:hypothetical protein
MAAVAFGRSASIRTRQKHGTLFTPFRADPKGELCNLHCVHDFDFPIHDVFHEGAQLLNNRTLTAGAHLHPTAHPVAWPLQGTAANHRFMTRNVTLIYCNSQEPN